MKQFLFIYILLFSASILFANKLDERVKTFDISQNGVLSANIATGKIKVSTWNKNKVEVKVKGIQDRNLNQYSIEKSGNEINIRYHGGWGNNIEFSVIVPTKFNLDLKTMSGDLSVISKIEGSVKLNTTGGQIRVKEIIGNVELHTSGGEIRSGDITGFASISTMGGTLRCGNFLGEGAELSTMGGDIHINDAQSKITAITYGGDIRVNYIDGKAEFKTYGGDIKIKGCSGDLEFETFGGDLTLEEGGGHVVAKTSGGDIKLYKLTGSTEASTSGGDIKVELDPEINSESYIESSGGDIRLYIPASANAEINAVIEVHGKWQNDRYEIKSYIDTENLNIDKSLKEITGHYILNKKKSTINLKTSNGDIKILKRK